MGQPSRPTFTSGCPRRHLHPNVKTRGVRDRGVFDRFIEPGAPTAVVNTDDNPDEVETRLPFWTRYTWQSS